MGIENVRGLDDVIKSDKINKKEGDTKVFDCFRCHIRFGKQYASKTDKGLCKYCEEFDDENGEIKE